MKRIITFLLSIVILIINSAYFPVLSIEIEPEEPVIPIIPDDPLAILLCDFCGGYMYNETCSGYQKLSSTTECTEHSSCQKTQRWYFSYCVCAECGCPNDYTHASHLHYVAHSSLGGHTPCPLS